MTELVLAETVAGVTTITLADEENKNALGGTLIAEMRNQLATANSNPEVRAVVITNRGTTFCAGANLKERSGSSGGARHSTSAFVDLLLEIQASPTPVIGKIKGHAVGGGVGLACALDISIAVDDVKMGFTEVRLGVAPAIISVICLPKMRRGDAMEAFLRGNRFSGARAAELGLITRAVPAEELEAEVDRVISDIVRGGPKALTAAKQLVNGIPNMDQAAAFEFASKLSADLFRGDEAAAGMKAFLGRTPAPWVPE